VFLQYGLACFVGPLRELMDDPEIRALLAASPQAGRPLRPLWRKLTSDPLPEVLQPPRKPRLAPAEPEAAAPEQASAVPAKPPAPHAARTPAWWCPAPPAEPPASPPPWPPPLFQT
jgi:hypothetical protein